MCHRTDRFFWSYLPENDGVFCWFVRTLTRADIRHGFTKLGKKGIRKLVVKLAKRSLGWVGAAFFVAEFTHCMGWWEL